MCGFSSLPGLDIALRTQSKLHSKEYGYGNFYHLSPVYVELSSDFFFLNLSQSLVYKMTALSVHVHFSDVSGFHTFVPLFMLLPQYRHFRGT